MAKAAKTVKKTTKVKNVRLNGVWYPVNPVVVRGRCRRSPKLSMVGFFCAFSATQIRRRDVDTLELVGDNVQRIAALARDKGPLGNMRSLVLQLGQVETLLKVLGSDELPSELPDEVWPPGVVFRRVVNVCIVLFLFFFGFSVVARDAARRLRRLLRGADGRAAGEDRSRGTGRSRRRRSHADDDDGSTESSCRRLAEPVGASFLSTPTFFGRFQLQLSSQSSTVQPNCSGAKRSFDHPVDSALISISLMPTSNE